VWIPVTWVAEDQWFREAYTYVLSDGTYELCGPKVLDNPEGFNRHTLIPHGTFIYPTCPTTYEELKVFLEPLDIEDIVWQNKDLKIVKVRKKDLGLTSKLQEAKYGKDNTTI
jgi:hypothetical protein